MKTKKFRRIIIEGKRWFRRSCGNTYHSVRITLTPYKGEQVRFLSGIHYGYDDHYRQTAAAILIKAGYFHDWNDFVDQTRDTKTRAKFYFTVSDVPRERDLE